MSQEKEPWKSIVYKVHYTTAGISGLSEDEHDYYVINNLCGEVYNGGLEQYFGNSSGDNYTELVETLKRLGHLGLAARLDAIVKAVFGDADMDSRLARTEILYGQDGQADNPLWGHFTDSELDALAPDLDRLYQAIAVRNGFRAP